MCVCIRIRSCLCRNTAFHLQRARVVGSRACPKFVTERARAHVATHSQLAPPTPLAYVSPLLSQPNPQSHASMGAHTSAWACRLLVQLSVCPAPQPRKDHNTWSRTVLASPCLHVHAMGRGHNLVDDRTTNPLQMLAKIVAASASQTASPHPAPNMT